MEQANNFVINLFLSIFSLFDNIYERFGAWSYLLGAFIVYTLYRYLLRPVLGGGVGSSDTVRKIRKEEE